MDIKPQDQALSAICPTCSALPGQPCRNSSLRQQKEPHPRRYAAGRKAAQVDCYACGGSGYLTEGESLDAFSNPITKNNDCRYCHGSGKGNGAPLS